MIRENYQTNIQKTVKYLLSMDGILLLSKSAGQKLVVLMYRHDCLHNKPTQKYEFRILAANEAPPVSSFTLDSKKGVAALPITFFSLMQKVRI